MAIRVFLEERYENLVTSYEKKSSGFFDSTKCGEQLVNSEKLFVKALRRYDVKMFSCLTLPRSAVFSKF